MLQATSPILFDLLLSVKDFPRIAMISVFEELIVKSCAPFKQEISPVGTIDLLEENELQSLAYFPVLQRVRERRTYEADRFTKVNICTKKSTGHPTLLPGVFTLFCQHGMLYLSHCMCYSILTKLCWYANNF